MTETTTLRVERSGSCVRLILARADVRNAFNSQLIDELTEQAEMLSIDSATRTVIIMGDGPQFCAGADLHWMQASANLSEAANVADAKRLGRMFSALQRLPQTVIGRAHGAVLGGGTGLLAICDTVLAAESTIFGFTEVRLGLIPAVISPYVVAKIGFSQARSLFVRGNRFDAATALRIGLIHAVVPDETLDSVLADHIAESNAAAPEAVAAMKLLLRELGTESTLENNPADERVLTHTARAIAKRRVSPEGQAGLAAFFARSDPPWKTQ